MMVADTGGLAAVPLSGVDASLKAAANPGSVLPIETPIDSPGALAGWSDDGTGSNRFAASTFPEPGGLSGGYAGVEVARALAEAEVAKAADPEGAAGEPRVAEAAAANQVDAAPDTATPNEATSPERLDPVRFNYCIDEIAETQINGWIQRRDQPSRRCVVLLREGERILGRATAAQFRDDLTWAGIGDGCHAFALPMPAALLDGDEHLLELVEEDTGFRLGAEPIRWRSSRVGGAAFAGTAGDGNGHDAAWQAALRADAAPTRAWEDSRNLPVTAEVGRGQMASSRATAAVTSGTRILLDISDLVFYLGHHPNPTGIQRVQSSIALCLLKEGLVPESRLVFLSYSHNGVGWVRIPPSFLRALLEDLLRPEEERAVSFSKEDARRGLLPGARKFDGTGLLDDGHPSVLCVIGAVWVWPDYFHHVLALKRQYGTRLVLEIHDLIPIFARETCDQETVKVFARFLRRALRHTDQFLAGSEYTRRDLERYATSLGLSAPEVEVVQYGSAIDEFWEDHRGRERPKAGTLANRDLPERFALCVGTIEGRKNHLLLLKIWRRLIDTGADPPHLICVGRVGWRSEPFITELVETDYLDGRVMLLQDISDADLQRLFAKCLFTVFPSLYEGWGLPVAESLAAGKVCVCSDRASIPEVAGDFGVYLNVDDPERCYAVVRDLLADPAARRELETRIRRDYRPISWRTVAQRIVAACEQAGQAEWAEPYPYARIPYSSEISFMRLEREVRSQFGEDLLHGIASARKGHFLSAALDEASFLLGEDARAGGQWSEPEDWGTWACGSGGEIAVALPGNGSPVNLVFLRLNVVPPLADVPISIIANGEPAWRGTIGTGSRDVFFAVRRRDAAARDWRLKIGAEVTLGGDLIRQIEAFDGRVPTIGFQRLVVVPEDDLRTRIDILSNLLLQRGD